MRETPDVVRRYVDFYAAAGADSIFVYSDGPAPELRTLDRPGLVLTEADEGFWTDRVGARPPVLEIRQSGVFQDALARCESDWLLVVDSDEFVFGDRPIPAFLDAIPAGVDSVVVPTAEAVWGPGDAIDAPFGSSHFRVAWRREKLWRALGGLVYGRAVAPYLQRGIAGHFTGKQFLRAGRGFSRIGNHAAEQDGRIVSRPARALGRSFEGMYVGHYDAIGLDRWRQKWRQRIEKDTIAANMNEIRTAQMATIAAGLAAGDGPSRALFRAFYGLSRPQYATLSALGYAFRREIFPG